MSNERALAIRSDDLDQLRRAAYYLEDDNIAVRLSDVIGGPIDAALKIVPPRFQRTIDSISEAVLLKALEWALSTMQPEASYKKASLLTVAGATATGGVAGMVGALSLPVVLPVSTMLFLRGIAEVARELQVNITDPQTRLECLFVLALGSRPKPTESVYWPIRENLSRSMTDAAQGLSQRGAVSASAPSIIALASRIAGRFGVMMSEHAAARSIPVLGAAVGATVNFLFMTHYKRMAFGHFTVLSLESVYGRNHVQAAYEKVLSEKSFPAKRQTRG